MSTKFVFRPKSTATQAIGEPPVARKPGVLALPKQPGQKPSVHTPKELALPEGCKMLRYGRTTFDTELGEQLIEAYYANGGSLSRACRAAGVKFKKAVEWRETIPELKDAFKEVDAIIDDEIHSQYKVRVLNEREPNPAWKIFYLKNHFPQYADRKHAVKITLDITDTLVKPQVIDAEVIKPLKDENDVRSEQPFALPAADSGKILQSD